MPLGRARQAAISTLGLLDIALGALLLTFPELLDPAPWRLVWPFRFGSLPRSVGALALVLGAFLVRPRRATEANGRRVWLRSALTWSAIARMALAAGLAGAVIVSTLPMAWTWIGGYDALAAIVQLAIVDIWSVSDSEA